MISLASENPGIVIYLWTGIILLLVLSKFGMWVAILLGLVALGMLLVGLLPLFTLLGTIWTFFYLIEIDIITVMGEVFGWIWKAVFG